MSAPPMPPGPPRPPGMRGTAPPVPPSFKANMINSAAAGPNQGLRMPPLPPGIARPAHLQLQQQPQQPQQPPMQGQGPPPPQPQRVGPEGAPMHPSNYPRQGMPAGPNAPRDSANYMHPSQMERSPYPPMPMPSSSSSSSVPPEGMQRAPRPGPYYPADPYARQAPYGPPRPSPTAEPSRMQSHPMPYPPQHPPISQQPRMPMNEMYDRDRDRERDRYMYDTREAPYPRSAYPPMSSLPGRQDGYDPHYNRYDPERNMNPYPHRGEEYGSYNRPRFAGPNGPAPRRGFHGSEESVLKLRDPTNTVWVGSLDPIAHSNEKLIRAMGEFGKIMQIARHDDKSFCFVHYRHVEEAEKAVETLSQTKALGVAVFNYGKMFTYSPEEMEMPYDPNDPNANRELLEPPPADGKASNRDSNTNRAMSGQYGGQNEFNNANAFASASTSGVNRANPSFSHGASSHDPNSLTRPTQRARYERDLKEPTNVLWIGSLPPSISEETLREVFEPFGTILQISRMERQMMAFIHFDTVEHCTMAIETMKGRPIEDGVVLVLNYGHSQRPNTSTESAAGAIPAHEVATNVVYLGQLPANVDERDIEQLLSRFDGFINTKYIVSSNVGFGHFDTIEHAKEARMALHGTTMKGVPIRVGFGKQNHTFTMADRRLAGIGASGTGGLGNNNENSHADSNTAIEFNLLGNNGEFNLDAMMRDPNEPNNMNSGALVLSNANNNNNTSNDKMTSNNAGALVLPAMGEQTSGRGQNNQDATSQATNVYNKERVAPEVTLEVRLHTLMGTLYNELGAKDQEINPSQIQTICNAVDECVDESSAAKLDSVLVVYVPVKCVHAFNIVAKRMREFFNDDPHKKLHILYTVTRLLLNAPTEFSQFTSSCINAYLMVLLVASERQTESGMDRISALIENLEHHSFIEKKAKVSNAYIAEFRYQLQEIHNRVKAEQDLASLLTKRRRRAR